MRTNRLQNLLAGTALGLALTLSHGALAQTNVDNVPVPNTEQLPPPTANDIGTVAPAASAKPEPSTMPMVDTAAAPQDLDAPVAEKLRESAGKLDRIFSRRNERTAVEAFYKDRNFAPLWVSGGKLSAAGKAASEYLARVDRDGLDPTDYPVPDFKSGDPASLADAELR